MIEGLAADSGRRGEALTVTITGPNLKEATAVSFGAGINIKEFRAVSDTEMRVRLTIGSEAELGARDFWLKFYSGACVLSVDCRSRERGGGKKCGAKRGSGWPLTDAYAVPYHCGV